MLFQPLSVATCVSWKHDGTELISGHEDGSVAFYDVEAREATRCILPFAVGTAHDDARITCCAHSRLEAFRPDYVLGGPEGLVLAPLPPLDGCPPLVPAQDAFHVVVACNERARVALSLEGELPLGVIDLRALVPDAAREDEALVLTAMSLRGDLSALACLLSAPHGQMLLMLDTAAIPRAAQHLHAVRVLAARVREICAHCDTALRRAKKAWAGAQGWRQFIDQLATSARAHTRGAPDASLEWLKVATCGPTTPALRHAVDHIDEIEVATRGRAHSAACDAVEGLLSGHAVPCAESAMMLLAELRAHALTPEFAAWARSDGLGPGDRFPSLVTEAMDAARRLLSTSTELLRDVRRARLAVEALLLPFVIFCAKEPTAASLQRVCAEHIEIALEHMQRDRVAAAFGITCTAPPAPEPAPALGFSITLPPRSSDKEAGKEDKSEAGDEGSVACTLLHLGAVCARLFTAPADLVAPRIRVSSTVQLGDPLWCTPEPFAPRDTLLPNPGERADYVRWSTVRRQWGRRLPIGHGQLVADLAWDGPACRALCLEAPLEDDAPDLVALQLRPADDGVCPWDVTFARLAIEADPRPIGVALYQDPCFLALAPDGVRLYSCEAVDWALAQPDSDSDGASTFSLPFTVMAQSPTAVAPVSSLETHGIRQPPHALAAGISRGVACIRALGGQTHVFDVEELRQEDEEEEEEGDLED